MNETQYNDAIEKIANSMIHDGISYDEQDSEKLAKYKKQAISDFNLDDKEAMDLVYESLLYRKLKNSDSGDPLQKGDQFGAGFS